MGDLITDGLGFIVALTGALGGVGSVVCAIYAKKQNDKAKVSAGDARDSADSALKVKAQVLKILDNQGMVRDIQKIINLVQKLKPYIKKGALTGKFGMNIKEDLDSIIDFRNQLKADSMHSESFKKQLDEMLSILTITDFVACDETERIEKIVIIIEYLNQIASEIDKKVKNYD